MRKYVLQLGSEVFQPGGVEESHFQEPKNLEVGSYICPKCEEGYELGMKLKKHTQEGTEEDRVWIAQVVCMWRTLKRT